MFKRMLMEIILEEGKRSMLQYITAHHLESANYIVNHIQANDPTPSKKYSMTILRWVVALIENKKQSTVAQYYTTNLELEEYYTRLVLLSVVSPIRRFDKLNGKLFEKNIQDFKSSFEFTNFMKNQPTTYISKRQYKLVSKNPENVKKIFENDKALVLHVKKFDASCVYGANTKWCITSNIELFKNYSESSTIYFIINKKVLPPAKLSKLAVLVDENEVEFRMSDKWLDLHTRVWDARDTLVYSNNYTDIEDLASEEDRDGRNREEFIEDYIGENFIDFVKTCKDLDIPLETVFKYIPAGTEYVGRDIEPQNNDNETDNANPNIQPPVDINNPNV